MRLSYLTTENAEHLRSESSASWDTPQNSRSKWKDYAGGVESQEEALKDIELYKQLATEMGKKGRNTPKEVVAKFARKHMGWDDGRIKRAFSDEKSSDAKALRTASHDGAYADQLMKKIYSMYGALKANAKKYGTPVPPPPPKDYARGSYKPTLIPTDGL